MRLSPGANLGPYQILSLIGIGGMGEVYKARDLRLERIVAIKLLHPELAERPDRRARFETEARAISRLNHPHVCTLFDVGHQDGAPFLVMEYLEGETLDDRLRREELPASELLRYATEIADALAHAHGEHIVHRDVKPSNVMLTASGAKLFDFGLAKSPVTEVITSASTLSVEHQQLTAEGTLIGTFHYMAPEQLEGKAADSRSDIFAFGTVLYEMGTRRKAFDGANRATLIASILTGQPPSIASVRPASEGAAAWSALDHVVERCLAKNPDQRWQTARDVKLELEWIGTSGTRLTPPAAARRPVHRREALAWTAAAVALATTAALALALVSGRELPRDTTRFIVAAPPGTKIGLAENRTRIAISPDGLRLAMVAFTDDGQSEIWVRSLDSVTAKPVQGTEGGQSPFWSPDGQFIGFFSPSDGLLKKVALTGGPARPICAAQTEGAAVWGRDGTILFSELRQGIYRVPSAGGTPNPVTKIDRTKGERSHLFPQFMPDGRHFLYLATAADANGRRATPRVQLASFDSSDVSLLTQMDSRVMFAPPDHLLFVQDGALLAQEFDTVRFRLIGEPIQIAEDVAYYRTLGNGAFTVSDNGVVAYQGSGNPFSLAWYDRHGNRADSSWPADDFGSLRISPDGERVAVDITDARIGTADIWFYDVARGTPVRFTTELTSQSQAVWSPDGSRVVFRAERLDGGAPSLYNKAIGTGDEDVLLSEPTPLSPEDWSPDGQWMAYVRQTRQTSWDLWLMPLAGEGKPAPFLATQFDEWSARFSPDSRWLAFASTESGAPEVYVAPVQEPGNRKRISIGGGTTPRWRRDGRELFYASADNRAIMAVSIAPGATLAPGLPTRLFSIGAGPVARDRARNTVYDVSADGQRFLVSVPAGEPSTSRVTVVLNWTAGLRR